VELKPRYTVLRVTERAQVPLLARHLERLGPEAADAARAFLASAAAGIYRLSWQAGALQTSLRPASRLVEGMPTRLVVSPFAHHHGRFPKPAPPSPYDNVRLDGVATLLTSADGRWLYESCAASIVAWNGAALVVPPEDVPGVASVAEAQVVDRLTPRRAPLAADSEWPLLLINAVVGTCAVDIPGRAPFPVDVRTRLDALVNA